MNNIIKYIGLPHQYGVLDCITLVRVVYEQELNILLELPIYTPSRHWMREYPVDLVDQWAKQYAEKVSLTEAKNYDLIVFKSDKSNLTTHFAIFLLPNNILHIEEGRTSTLSLLNDYWRQRIYAVYRHHDLV
jgi:cell wall-associated NlpC family hydrolase